MAEADVPPPLGRARRYYVRTVWVLAIPATLLFGVMGLYGSITVPLFMTPPLLVAVVITFPLIGDRPGTHGPLTATLLVLQCTAAYAALILLGGTPTRERANLSGAFWVLGTLLAFVVLGLGVRAAFRSDASTRKLDSGHPAGDLPAVAEGD